MWSLSFAVLAYFLHFTNFNCYLPNIIISDSHSEGQYNQNLFLVSQCVCGGSLAGLLIGGRIGARIGAVEHIENTTLAVYQSSVHAQVRFFLRFENI